MKQKVKPAPSEPSEVQWAIPEPPSWQGTIRGAALTLLVCATLTALLTTYGLATAQQSGSRAYQAFGLLASFAFLAAGLSGLRSAHLFYNRNYVSGYIVLAVFSVLACGGEVLLISSEDHQQLRDLVGGAEAALALLTLLMLATGAVASSGCRRHPTDNRVWHYDDETV